MNNSKIFSFIKRKPSVHLADLYQTDNNNNNNNNPRNKFIIYANDER
jgi:hypothetical protein